MQASLSSLTCQISLPLNVPYDHAGHAYDISSNAESMPQQQSQQLDKGPNTSLLADELQKQWHDKLNTHLGNTLITPGSKRKVWWSCDQCPDGLPHIWEATVYQGRMEGAVLSAQATLFVSITRLPDRHLKLHCFGMPRRAIHCQ